MFQSILPGYHLVCSFPLKRMNFYSHICSLHMLIKNWGGGEHRNMTGEPWLGRNNGHKEEFLRYRQLSKLSSAFAWAAVFALYFLNPWITLYNKNNRVKTDFLKQRKQSVFLKDYPILVGKWNSRKKKKEKKCDQTHGATSHMRLFWQTSPDKNTHQEFIYSHSIYCFCLDSIKDRLMLHKNNLKILHWLQLCLFEYNRTKATFNRLLTASCPRTIKNVYN